MISHEENPTFFTLHDPMPSGLAATCLAMANGENGSSHESCFFFFLIHGISMYIQWDGSNYGFDDGYDGSNVCI